MEFRWEIDGTSAELFLSLPHGDKIAVGVVRYRGMRVVAYGVYTRSALPVCRTDSIDNCRTDVESAVCLDIVNFAENIAFPQS